MTECDHVCNWYPSEEVINSSGFWSWNRVVTVRLHWYCEKCGIELEPVFRVKGVTHE